jgi:hypothetical protein
MHKCNLLLMRNVHICNIFFLFILNYVFSYLLFYIYEFALKLL